MKDYIVKQNDYADCGACSLLSIIKYYNGYVPLEIIKLDTLTNSDGTTFYNLKEAGIKYGFEVVGYNNKNIREIKCPFIVQLKINNMYHFVVVYEIKDDYLLCMDPAIGIKKYDYIEFNQIFTGNILKLNPVGKIVKYQKNNYFKDLVLKMIKQNVKVFIIILILSIIIFILSLINISNVKDVLENNYELIILFVIILLLKNLLDYIKNNLLANLSKNNNIYLIKDYINNAFSLPSKYLQLNRSGEITSRINDLNNLKDFFTKELINLIIYSIFFLIIVIIMFYLNTKLSLILFLLSILYFIFIYYLNKKGFKYYLNYLNSNTTFMDNIIEDINALSNIKNLGQENYFLSKICNNININNSDAYKLEKYLNKTSLTNNLFKDFSLILIIMVNKSSVNILIYILYFNYYLDIISYYSNLLPNFSYFKSIISRLNGIYYLKEKDSNNEAKIANNSIQISNLFYKINLNKIFDNFNLNIKANEKVLIKGINGVGKSTLLNIINGNITDYEGNVSIGSINIKSISKKGLKEKVLYCSESDKLFTDSVINNIILNKKYDQKKFNIIENILNLKGIISKKENGYNALIKDNFSRGEKQRIVIARALYQDTDIILFDEALSEISYYLRHKIIYKINNYYKYKTIIYVSHNLEDNYFDRIINLTARKDKGIC